MLALSLLLMSSAQADPLATLLADGAPGLEAARYRRMTNRYALMPA